MSSPLLLGIDEGTTAVKAALFDRDLRAVAEARRPVPVTHPAPGLVEQDPALILEAVIDAVAERSAEGDKISLAEVKRMIADATAEANVAPRQPWNPRSLKPGVIASAIRPAAS